MGEWILWPGPAVTASRHLSTIFVSVRLVNLPPSELPSLPRSANSIIVNSTW